MCLAGAASSPSRRKGPSPALCLSSFSTLSPLLPASRLCMRSCKTNAGWTPLVTPLPPAASRRGRRLPAQRRLQVHWDRARAGRKKMCVKNESQNSSRPPSSCPFRRYGCSARDSKQGNHVVSIVRSAGGRGPRPAHLWCARESVYIYICLPLPAGKHTRSRGYMAVLSCLTPFFFFCCLPVKLAARHVMWPSPVRVSPCGTAAVMRLLTG